MFLYSLFAEIIQPINCILISEDVPSISIVLTERRSNSLKGTLFIFDNKKGTFYTYKPTNKRPAGWSFEKGNIVFKGEAILLKEGKIWHRYQNSIKSHEVNRVLFSGLSTKLEKVTNEGDLLKATSGFFKIGNECYGGRIKKV